MKLIDEIHQERLGSGISWPQAVGQILKYRCLLVVCQVRGHDLVDEGYGNPESGCIDVCCKRCGWSAGRVWLY